MNGICIFCNTEKEWVKNHQIFCKLNPKNIETREKISRGLKKSHESGKHPGWNHINRNKNKRSKPEEIFLEWINNDNFFKKYTIEEKKPFHKYTLDFAILDLKCDIEIDGIQHIRSKKNINHDIKRDEFLIESGWIVYRIAVKDFYMDKKGTIEELKKWLDKKEKHRIYDIDKLKTQLKNKKYGSMEKYLDEIKKQKYLRNIEKINLVKSSDIDFLKFGWVNKVSQLIGIRHQRVNKWMKDFLPDIFEFAYKKK